jgi:hypothetical protein
MAPHSSTREIQTKLINLIRLFFHGRRAYITMGICLLNGNVSASHNEPPQNPYLADSSWPIFHGNAAQTAYSPVQLSTISEGSATPKSVQWVPIGPSNSYDIKYSGVYPDGGRASWVGGSDLIYKIDTQTLDVISVYSLRRGVIRTQNQVLQELNTLDTLTARAESDPAEERALFSRVADTLSPILRTTGSGAIYNLLSSDNEYYTLTWDPNAGKSTLSVYGDKTPGDRNSAIEFKRRWPLPSGQSRAIALNMTYDGWLIIATLNGIVYAVSRDFTEFRELVLPGSPVDSEGSWMTAFMRNGIAIDDEGGIYILTLDNLHRVQWTGNKLSLDEKDGAWTEAYDGGPTGGGITPTLIGWGDEDKLVISSTGNDQQDEFEIYWRSCIPKDWQGIAHRSSRLAAVAAIRYSTKSSEGLVQEGSPVALGYGFFTTDPRPNQPFPDQGSADRNIFASMAAQMLTKYALNGATKYRWDPEARKIESAWTTDTALFREICTVSADEILFCQGRRDNAWTIEAIDWNTGESMFHFILGNSQKFNSGGGGIRLTPDGNIEYPSALTWGFTRIELH